MTPTEDLKEYLGDHFKPVVGSDYVAREWNQLNPKTHEETINAYKLVEGYMYDLAQWHETPHRLVLTDEIFNILSNNGISSVLDFGAGICTDAMHLRKNGLKVSITDLPSSHYAFGLWRIAKYMPSKINIIDIDKVWESKYECIMLIDVLEHIVDIKPFIKILCRRTNKILERSPFGVKHGVTGVEFPMHTSYHRNMIYSLFEKYGFKAVETIINDGQQLRLWTR